VTGSGTPADPGPAQVKVRQAARAMARAGLSGPYGHCSTRLGEDRFLVCSGKALSRIGPTDQGVEVSTSGPLPDGVLGEVRVHQQIYARRPDVGGIVRFLSPHLLSLSALHRAPLVRHGFGAYFAPQAAFWPDPALLRSDDRAAAVAAALGSGRGIILRGNGAVVAGDTLEQALALAWFLEDAARVELDMLQTGIAAAPYTLAEADTRATWAGGVVERMWDHLVGDDQV
jgi:HCOMODA/2-hydroxy-3-carboxy-muconic semialdehyde decarboxylase